MRLSSNKKKSCFNVRFSQKEDKQEQKYKKLKLKFHKWWIAEWTLEIYREQKPTLTRIYKTYIQYGDINEINYIKECLLKIELLWFNIDKKMNNSFDILKLWIDKKIKIKDLYTKEIMRKHIHSWRFTHF